MEALDYDPNEKNRALEPVTIMLGTFFVKGFLRISAATSVGTNLEIGYSGWMSVYEAEISNPFLPQMAPMQVPMMLVVPTRVNFGR